MGIVARTQQKHEHERELERTRQQMGESSRRRTFDVNKHAGVLSIEQARQQILHLQPMPEPSLLAAADFDEGQQATSLRRELEQREVRTPLAPWRCSQDAPPAPISAALHCVA
eukprot:6827180-Prymnesium_polylepis.1